MHAQFKDLLHRTSSTCSRCDHDKKDAAQITKECMAISNDVLNQKYHYHFHKLPDADRAEIINMINNYTREALLPPVIREIVHRHVTA
jgi:hypothetical protein